MLPADVVVRETVAYRLKLPALLRRYASSERTEVAAEAQTCADALICLMEEAPLNKRQPIDYLIDRYEASRASSVH